MTEDTSKSTDSASDTDLSMLMSSAVIVFLGQVLYSASSLLERIALANVLSPDAYAQVSIGLSVLLLGSTVSMFGLGPGIPRFMSRFDGDVDLRGVFVTGLGILVPMSFGVTAVLYWQIDLIGAYLLDEGDSFELLTLFVLAIPVLTTLKGMSAAIRGMENTVYYIVARQLVYTGLRLLLLVVLLGLGWGLLAAGYAYVISATVALAIAAVLLHRMLPLWGPFRTRSREMLTFSTPLLMSAVASILLSKTDTLLVGFYRTNTEVAYYDTAYPLANGMLVFLTAFGFLYLPLTSRLDSEDRTSEVDSIYKLSTKWVYLLTFPVFLLLFAFPIDTLRIVFRPEYVGAWPALSILAAGFLVQAGTGRCRETLSAFGHTRIIFAVDIGTFLFNLGLNVLLIPRYGFVAAAAASAVALALQNATMIGVLWQRFGITPFASATVRTFLVLPAVLIPLTVLTSYAVDLSVVTFVASLVLLPTASLAVYVLGGCTEPEDRIAIDIVEERIGRPVPFVDRFLPPQ